MERLSSLISSRNNSTAAAPGTCGCDVMESSSGVGACHLSAARAGTVATAKTSTDRLRQKILQRWNEGMGLPGMEMAWLYGSGDGQRGYIKFISAKAGREQG